MLSVFEVSEKKKPAVMSENPSYQHFLLIPQSFQRLFQEHSTLHHPDFYITALKKEAFENIVYQHFLLLPQCFFNIYLFIHKELLTHYHTILHSDPLKIYSGRKHCGKRKNCL